MAAWRGLSSLIQHFTLEAEVRPVANEPPRISWKFTARTPGWYTVGYTGAPSEQSGDGRWLPAAADLAGEALSARAAAEPRKAWAACR